MKALPPNIPSALETLALMVDDIWYMAGDKSTDVNWYTKRALLASLYTSTGTVCVCVCVCVLCVCVCTCLHTTLI